MKPLPPRHTKLRLNQKIWALRILRLVRIRAVGVDHPDVARAFAIIGFEQAAQILNGGPKPKRQSAQRDAMNRRVPGSFETNPRRH
jgi:hypothetical protein